MVEMIRKFQVSSCHQKRLRPVQATLKQSKGSLSTGLEIRVVVYIYGWCQTYHCDVQLISHYAVWQDNSYLHKGCAGCIVYCSRVVLATRPSPNDIALLFIMYLRPLACAPNFHNLLAATQSF
jgi:hypothetical protein